MRFAFAIAVFALASPAHAQLSGINFQNNGVSQGRAQTLNADGTTLTCSVSHGIATCHAVASGQFSSDVVPTADATFNLGDSSTPLRWASVNALSYNSGFSQTLFSNTFSTGGTSPAYIWDLMANVEASLFGPNYRFRSGSEQHNIIDFSNTSSGAEIDGYQTGNPRGIVRFNNLGVTIDGSGSAANLIPASDNSQNNGASNRRWSGVFTVGLFNGGALSGKYRSASSAVTVANTDHFIGVSGAGARTVNLPAANTFTAGQMLVVQDIGNSAGAITINPSGSDNINGANAAVSIASAFGRKVFFSDGVSNWYTDVNVI